MEGEFSRPPLSSAQAPEQFFRYSNYPKRALSRGKPINYLINRCNSMFAVGARGRGVDGFISTGRRFPCYWGSRASRLCQDTSPRHRVRLSNQRTWCEHKGQLVTQPRKMGTRKLNIFWLSVLIWAARRTLFTGACPLTAPHSPGQHSITHKQLA